MRLTLTRKCYQQAFSSFQRHFIVELNCEFSSLLIKKEKMLKTKTRPNKKHRKLIYSCHRHNFSKFPNFSSDKNKILLTIEMQNVSFSSGFSFLSFFKSGNSKHISFSFFIKVSVEITVNPSVSPRLQWC